MKKRTQRTEKINVLLCNINRCKTLCLCSLFLFTVAITSCSKEDDEYLPIEKPEPEPEPETTEGNIDEWNWESENADKGLVETVQ